MKQIQITPAELRSQAAEMTSLRAEYERLFSDLDTVLNRANDAWSENLSHNFVGKITTTKKSCSSILEALDWGVNAANKSADSFESLDNGAAVKLNGGENASGNGGDFSSGGGDFGGGGGGGGFRGGDLDNTKVSWWDRMKKGIVEGAQAVSTGVAKVVDKAKDVVSTVSDIYEKKGLLWKVVKTAGAVASGVGAVVSAAAAWGITGGSAGLAAPAAALVTVHASNTLASSFSDIYNCWFGDKEQVGQVNVLKSLDKKVLGDTLGTAAYNIGSITSTVASISALAGKVKQAPDMWKAIKGTPGDIKKGVSGTFGVIGDVFTGKTKLTHVGAQMSLMGMELKNVDDLSKCVGVLTAVGTTTKKIADAVAEPLVKAIAPGAEYNASFVQNVFGKDSVAAKAETLYKDVKGATSAFKKDNYTKIGDAYEADKLPSTH